MPSSAAEKVGPDEARREPSSLSIADAGELLSADEACFPIEDGLDLDGLRASLGETLTRLRRQSEPDPFANPIQLLALDVLRRLDGGALTLGAIERLIQRLTVEAFVDRSERLAGHLGERGREANLARLRALFQGLTRAPDGDTVPFDTFRRRIERPTFGLVVTAHPTFSLASDLRRTLVELAVCPEDDDGRRRALAAEAARRVHRPERALDLETEHRQSIEALENVHEALRPVFETVLDVAREVYPDRWAELRPRPLTVASWVGYDLDGRSDIPWSDTFARRLRIQAIQLARYRASVRALRGRIGPGDARAPILDLLDARLSLAVKEAKDEVEVFLDRGGDDEATWRARLRRIAGRMYAERPSRLVDSAPLVELLDRAVALGCEPDIARDLCVLRAEILTHGLGLAHTHVRINAVQLHNAVRKSIGMETAPDDPSYRRSYVAAVSRLIEEAEPASVNFGSILAERATAKRVLMIVAQMLKYLDATQPVRFLIAECETPLTLLTALYFAKLFGVDDRIDISPLFETLAALDRGAQVIDEALDVDAFRDYVRRRGRLCVQTGFSDAGRYMGQIAAAVAIERLKLRLAPLLARRGLDDVELVVFDTHGESIGRGAHPGGLVERLRYVDSPATRRQFALSGIAHKEEVSFQGGDGYVHFMTVDAALATVSRVLEHALVPPDDEADVPLYAEADYVDEFFTVIRQFNARVMDDPSYAALLGAFGANMLYPSGSRAAKRQHDALGRHVDLEHPSQLRAIPHNSILQQLGFLANSIGGVGQAVTKDPERFQRLYADSPRFRRLMNMVEHAFKWSDLNVTRAYVALLDPGLWLMRAGRREGSRRALELRKVSDALEAANLHGRIAPILRVFHRDYLDLADALREHRRRTRDAGEAPIAVDAASRDRMHTLHALRLALIQRLFLLAVRVSDFSPRHGVTREDLVTLIMHLDVEPALAQLAEIFPVTEAGADGDGFDEPATYRSAESQSYAQEHEELFRPMGRIYELIRRVGSGVIHHVGAIG